MKETKGSKKREGEAQQKEVDKRRIEAMLNFPDAPLVVLHDSRPPALHIAEPGCKRTGQTKSKMLKTTRT